MRDQRERTFDAGFDFARHLRNADFRAFLKASGWVSGQHVIMATDDTPIRDVMAKMVLHDLARKALIAVAHEGAPFGFRLITVATVRPRLLWRRRPWNTISVSPDSSVGMLYSAAETCGAFVPSQWSRDLLFERVGASTN